MGAKNQLCKVLILFFFKPGSHCAMSITTIVQCAPLVITHLMNIWTILQTLFHQKFWYAPNIAIVASYCTEGIFCIFWYHSGDKKLFYFKLLVQSTHFALILLYFCILKIKTYRCLKYHVIVHFLMPYLSKDYQQSIQLGTL